MGKKNLIRQLLFLKIIFKKQRKPNNKILGMKDINTNKGEIKSKRIVWGMLFIPFIFENLDELDNFLDKYNLRKLN